ncbi:MAG: lysophospholipid acyltransferase family protein [Myxococcota bacterium]
MGDSLSSLAPRALAWRHGIQREVARLAAPLWIPLAAGVLRYGLGYRIEDLSWVRAEFERLRGQGSGPMLVCANHLTLIDSMLVAWALAGPGRYLVHFREFPWNLPEASNFAYSWWTRILIYLAKCIPVVRGGRREEVARVIQRVIYLTRRGERALIFPEGGRSRSGRVEVEKAAWGVGRIVGAIPGCRVLCVYLRGDHQVSFSARPVRGERFSVTLRCIEPKSDRRGVRRSRDLAQAVLAELAAMERRYLADRQ